MKRIIFLLFITQLAWTQNEKVYPTVSYLDIKLGESGHLSSNPYILEFKNGKKEIVFCGVEHLSDNSDVSNKMFAEIERKFFEFRPNIAINEGGEISKNNYLNKEEAILKDGEIGLLKVLSDSLKIKTINGDPNFEHECKALLKTYSKSELLTYIITERLMWNLYGNRIIDQAKIEAAYNEFVENYIIKKGKITVTDEQKQFDFYKKNYKKLVQRKFDINTLKPTNPFDSKSKFQAIGRKSKEIRDQYLLNTIARLLRTNDKVFIVFGGWHLLTCEPGLKEIINQVN